MTDFITLTQKRQDHKSRRDLSGRRVPMSATISVDRADLSLQEAISRIYQFACSKTLTDEQIEFFEGNYWVVSDIDENGIRSAFLDGLDFPDDFKEDAHAPTILSVYAYREDVFFEEIGRKLREITQRDKSLPGNKNLKP